MTPDTSSKKSVLARSLSNFKKARQERRLQTAASVSLDDWGDPEEVTPQRSVSSRAVGLVRSMSSASWGSGENEKPKTDWKKSVSGLFRSSSASNGGASDSDDWSSSEDSSSEGEELPVVQRNSLRRTTSNKKKRRAMRRKKGSLDDFEMAELRDQVASELHYDAEWSDPRKNTPWRRFQRCTGILRLRLEIRAKNQQVEREPPDYPYIYYHVNKMNFEFGVGALIILNSINIGIDAMYTEGEDQPTWLRLSEHFFVAAFLAEWCLRVMAFSWAWIFEPMNFFDTFIVWVTGVLTSWLLVPAGVNVDLLQRFAALRVLRVTRLIRTIRIMPQFRELWTLVNGMLSCMPLVFWALVFIGYVHFCGAVVMREVIAKDPLFEDDEVVQNQFADMPSAMFTLFQLMTFDTWNRIVRRVQAAMPWSAVLFGIHLGVCGIVLVNLMTAVVVMNAFTASAADDEAVAEQKKIDHRKWQHKLKRIFMEMDDDGSGMLSRGEFFDIIDDLLFIRMMKRLDIDIEELPDIFELLDDGDGEVSMDEFVIGMSRIQGNALSKDMMKATRRMDNINESLLTVEGTLHLEVKDMGVALGDLDQMHDEFYAMQGQCAAIIAQLDQVGIRRAVKVAMRDLPEPPSLEEAVQSEPFAKQDGPADADPAGATSRGVRFADARADANADAQRRVPPANWIARRRQAVQAKNIKKMKGSRQIQDMVRGGIPTHLLKHSGVVDHFKDIWEALDLPLTLGPEALRPIKTPEGAFKPKPISGMGERLAFSTPIFIQNGVPQVATPASVAPPAGIAALRRPPGGPPTDLATLLPHMPDHGDAEK